VREIAGIKTYSSDDLIKELKVSKPTLFNYLKSGLLIGKKLGCSWMVTQENLEKFLNESGLKNIDGTYARNSKGFRETFKDKSLRNSQE